MSNDEYQHQSTWSGSKHFKTHEIIGYLTIDGKRVTYLKMGVVSKRYYDWVDPTTLEGHLNTELINYQRWEEYYKRIIGTDDFEKD
jgi:hypothetical protein